MNEATSGQRVEVLRTRSVELLSTMGPEMYREAAKRGVSLSVLLESEDPSSDYPATEGLDAFERCLQVSGIRTNTITEMGCYADKFDAFDAKDTTRALVPEFVKRVWRRTATGNSPSTRSLYASTDYGTGSVMAPYVSAAQARVQQIAPAIPLDEVVAITTPIDSDTYRAFYLVNDPANQHRTRVAQGAEIQRAKLVGGDRPIKLDKYGRALEITYESLRRMRIDMVALQIARMAIQAESDKVATVVNILVNGDGNAQSIGTTYRGHADLDPASTVGQLTLKGWLAFKMKFTNPYALTHALAQDVTMEQAFLLNTGTANIPLLYIAAQQGLGSFTNINPHLGDNVRIGWTPDAPASKIIGFDKRFAIERVTEIGSDITEVERWASRQTQELIMSENEGYDILDPFAIKILDLTA